jgi:hypothetical protein
MVVPLGVTNPCGVRQKERLGWGMVFNNEKKREEA